MKSLKKNIFFNVIKSVNSFIFPLITFSYVSHILYAEGMGRFEFARSYTAYFSILAMLGIVNYATREAAKRRDNLIEFSRFVHEILFINLISVMLAGALYGISIMSIKELQSYRVLLYVNAFSIPLTAMGLDWLYSALEQYQYIALRSCLVQAVSLILTLLFVKNSEDVVWYTAITVIATAGANIFNFFNSRKFVIYQWLGNYHLKKHLKSIMILFGMTICVQIFSNIDATMLGLMIGETSVGLYSAAIKMSNVVISLIVAFTAVLAPRIAYYYQNQNWNEIKNLSNKAFQYILLFAVPATCGLFLVAKEIILVFNGASYMSAVLTARIVAFRVLLSPLNTFLMVHLAIPIGKEKNNALTAAIATIGNVLLNIILIPGMEQDGAAIATVVTELIEFIINIFLMGCYIDLKDVRRKMRQYLIGSAAIFFVWYILKNILSGIGLIVVLTATSIFIYILVLILLKNDEILEIFHRIAQKSNRGTD